MLSDRIFHFNAVDSVQSLLLLLLLLLLARFLQLIMQLKPASESESAAQIGLFYPCVFHSSFTSAVSLSTSLPLSLSLLFLQLARSFRLMPPLFIFLSALYRMFCFKILAKLC